MPTIKRHPDVEDWIPSEFQLPELKIVVRGYGVDGSELKVCRIMEYNRNSEYDLGADYTDCWINLEYCAGHPEHEILPMDFITHWEYVTEEIIPS